MIGALKRAYDSFRGFGDYAFSIPPLDGAFMPNAALDGAPLVLAAHGADNLTVAGTEAVFSCGPDLMTLDGTVLDRFDGPITALAGGKDGSIVVAVGDQLIWRASNGNRHEMPSPCGGADITALALLSDGALAVAAGSTEYKAADWQCDLMERGQTGAVYLIDAGGNARTLASGLGFPTGLAEAPDGSLIVSCAWDHLLLRVTTEGAQSFALDNLPAYPGRLIRSGGGYWLSFVSIRNQLVEFTLRERPYVQRMMAEVPREFWVCPQLRPPQSPMAVMQAGAERHHGEMKPWAPSLSYGLIVRLDAALQPQFSLHSRADGDRHGLTSIAAVGDRLLASSHAAGGIIEIPMAGGTA